MTEVKQQPPTPTMTTVEPRQAGREQIEQALDEVEQARLDVLCRLGNMKRGAEYEKSVAAHTAARQALLALISELQSQPPGAAAQPAGDTTEDLLRSGVGGSATDFRTGESPDAGRGMQLGSDLAASPVMQGETVEGVVARVAEYRRMAKGSDRLTWATLEGHMRPFISAAASNPLITAREAVCNEADAITTHLLTCGAGPFFRIRESEFMPPGIVVLTNHKRILSVIRLDTDTVPSHPNPARRAAAEAEGG